MRVVVFCHSLISDWNHGNAHFLRGVVGELLARGHRVAVYEPTAGWSLTHLVEEAGAGAIGRFRQAFPALHSHCVDLDRLPLDEALEGADLVLVHEWNPHSLVARIGRHRARGGRYVLLFHDTHHRSVTDVSAMEQYALEAYDGVLAFGEVIRRGYESRGWARRAWTWHEAADTRVFTPRSRDRWDGDLVWIGNWGDEERNAEIRQFLIEPVQQLRLASTIYGVRYPQTVREELATANISYRGWIANYDAPMAYARHQMTVHIPRRPYVERLPGIPTIRVFEALAAGVPLVSMHWPDVEGLFTPGEDFLVARSPAAMRRHLAALAADRSLRERLVAHGLRTVCSRHTCAHRVDELLHIVQQIRGMAVPQVLSV